MSEAVDTFETSGTGLLRGLKKGNKEKFSHETCVPLDPLLMGDPEQLPRYLYSSSVPNNWNS